MKRDRLNRSAGREWLVKNFVFEVALDFGFSTPQIVIIDDSDWLEEHGSTNLVYDEEKNRIEIPREVLHWKWDLLLHGLAHELGHARDRKISDRVNRIFFFLDSFGLYLLFGLGLLGGLWGWMVGWFLIYLYPIVDAWKEQIFERRADLFALTLFGSESFVHLEKEWEKKWLEGENFGLDAWWEVFYPQGWIRTHPEHSERIRVAGFAGVEKYREWQKNEFRY